MKKRFSIQDGYQVVMIFLTEFWCKFLKGGMVDRGLIHPEINQVRNVKGQLERGSFEDELHRDNDFFFLSVCDGTSDDYFSDILEKKWGIAKMDQLHFSINESEAFQLAIDFCNYFNEKYQKESKDSLRFAIDWMENMKKDPNKHKEEWGIWDGVVNDVIEKGERSQGFL